MYRRRRKRDVDDASELHSGQRGRSREREDELARGSQPRAGASRARTYERDARDLGDRDRRLAPEACSSERSCATIDTLTTEADLLAAIEADPTDDTRLVYADFLLANGDVRGKLIVLDVRDRHLGGLHDPEALTELLKLAAEHGFPHLPDPDAHLLPWERADDGLVASAFATTFNNAHYRLAYGANGYIAVSVDHVPLGHARIVAKPRLADEDINVVLSVASRDIRAGRFHIDTFRLPTTETALRAHADYRLGPYPRYVSHEIADDFGHPEWTLQARDYTRWYTLWDRLVGPAGHDY